MITKVTSLHCGGWVVSKISDEAMMREWRAKLTERRWKTKKKKNNGNEIKRRTGRIVARGRWRSLLINEDEATRERCNLVAW